MSCGESIPMIPVMKLVIMVLLGTLPSGLLSPRGIGYDGNKWLVLDNSDHELWRINPDDPSDETGDYGLVGSLPSGLADSSGIGYGENKWLAIDFNTDELWRINPDDPR